MVNLKFKTTALAVSLLCLNACGGSGSSYTGNNNQPNYGASGKWDMQGYVESTIPSSDSVQSQWQKAALDDKRESVRGSNAGVFLNMENIDMTNANISSNASRSTKYLKKQNGEWNVKDLPSGEYSYTMSNIPTSLWHGTNMATVVTKLASDTLIHNAPRADNTVLSGLDSALQSIKGGGEN